MAQRRQRPRPNLIPKILILLCLLVIVIAVAGVYIRRTTAEPNRGGATSPPPTQPGAAENPGMESDAANHDALVADSNSTFRPLVGRWLREDGGYVIEIRSAHADGTLEAAYFNPAPIHVAKAAAAQEQGVVKVAMELRDVNYPGSLYALVLDPAVDQLQGTYFQAAQRQTYPVRFIRMRE